MKKEKRDDLSLLVGLLVYAIGGFFSWGVWSAQNWPTCSAEVTAEGYCDNQLAQFLGAWVWPLVWVMRLGIWVAS